MQYCNKTKYKFISRTGTIMHNKVIIFVLLRYSKKCTDLLQYYIYTLCCRLKINLKHQINHKPLNSNNLKLKDKNLNVLYIHV